MMKKLFVYILFLATLPSISQTIGYPDALYSKAERTQYQETSRHQDVMNFVLMLDAASEILESAHLRRLHKAEEPSFIFRQIFTEVKLREKRPR